MVQEGDPGKDKTANVAIHIRQPSGDKLQKLAVMWCPNSNNEELSLISLKLVTEVLRIDVQDIENRSTIQLDGDSLEVRGFVDLEWSVYAHGKRRRNKPTYTTRFRVTAQEDPPFDILVGERIARDCGL